MTNTGTWNSDFAIFLFLAFFFPVFAVFLAGAFYKVVEIFLLVYQAKLNNEFLQDHQNNQVFCLEMQRQETIMPPLPKTSKRPPLPTVKKQQIQDDEMYLDAVAGLVGIGYKKSEARRIISKACNEKDYENAEDIISDVISSVYK